MKPVLPFVEIMATQTCNISCLGCSNYSDLVHSGYLRWQDAQAQIEPWLGRVEIPDFGILGGEPLMNPDIRNWLVGLRTLLPKAQIRFTTNGLLLEKNFDIVSLLADIGNCVFKIAVHVPDEALERTIQRIYELYPWEPVEEFGMQRYRTGNNLRFHVRRPEIFWKTFRGEYHNMAPHNSDPASAFSICCQQTCPLLYKGRIYKCSTSGLLSEVLARHGNPNRDKWQPFLHAGLAPDCDDRELAAFLANFGRANSLCRMCPTSDDLASKIVHLDNVSTRKKKT